MRILCIVMVLALVCLAWAKPTIEYIQLAPSLMPDDADADCQALITYSGDENLSVRYYIWDSSTSRISPAYSGDAECAGESWKDGIVCRSGYFDPKGLTGIVTCCIEVSDGEGLVGKNTVAARTCGEDCPPDCGNGVCDGEETASTCAQDCLNYRLEATVLSPECGRKVNMGERLTIRVSLKSASEMVTGANVTATGTFGEAGLYDDGQHGDGTMDDGVYAGEIVFPSNTPAGSSLIAIKAQSQDMVSVEYVNVLVVGNLDVGMELAPAYKLGDIILVTFTFRSSGERANGEANASMYSPSGALVHTEDIRFSNGIGTCSYHSTLEDEVGNWTVNVSGVDKFGNAGLASGTFEMAKLAPGSFLEVTPMGPVVGTYKRGTIVSVTAKVERNGQAVSGADVVFISPKNVPVRMSEIGNGIYGSPYNIWWDDPAGPWTISMRATLDTDSGMIEGVGSTGVNVVPSAIQVGIMKPDRGEFGVGESIEVLVKAEYQDGSLVNASRARMETLGEVVDMVEVAPGVYGTTHVVKEGQEGDIIFSVNIEDESGNSGSKSVIVKVKGTSVLYYVGQNVVVFAVLLLVAVVGGALIVKKYIGRSKKEKLEKRKGDIIEKQKKLQEQYLKEGSVDRQTFYEMSEKYNRELDSIDGELESMGGDND